MRLLIVTFVVIAHVAAIVWLLDVDVRSSSTPLPATEQDQEEAAGTLPATEQAAGEQRTAGSVPSSRAVGPVSPASLRASLVALPAELSRKTTECKTGIILDWDRQSILWGKDEKRAVPIASLTKMMTALLTREAIDAKPSLTLQTRVQVTPSVAKIGGSQVYLDPRENFSLDELLKCIMIFSANDASQLLAEFIGDGHPEGFVKRMNSRARELGMRSAKFYNAHGLPDNGGRKQNSASALDMAWLAGHLLQYPTIVKWSSTWIESIRDDSDTRFQTFQLVNRNRLVRTCEGVNGMKTGFTQAAGFCVAATCERGGRKVVVVVTGCSSSKRRNDLVADLLDWAYLNLKP